MELYAKLEIDNLQWKEAIDIVIKTDIKAEVLKGILRTLGCNQDRPFDIPRSSSAGMPLGHKHTVVLS